MIVRFAGLPDGVFRLANSGRYFATGSATLSLPSSCSIRIATPVTGLVIDAIQNSVSGVIGRLRRDIGEPGALEVKDLVLRDDHRDRAGDLVLRDHLLHRGADTGKRRGSTEERSLPGDGDERGREPKDYGEAARIHGERSNCLLAARQVRSGVRAGVEDPDLRRAALLALCQVEQPRFSRKTILLSHGGHSISRDVGRRMTSRRP